MTEAEWLKGGLAILKWEARRGWPNPRKQRLFSVACCRRLLLLLPDQPRLELERALTVADRYADHQAKRTDLQAVRPHFRYDYCSQTRTCANVLLEFATNAVCFACEPF